MSDILATSVISGIAAVLVAFIGIWQIRISRDVRVTKSQLENSHVDDPRKESNLREDMDQKHSAVLSLLQHVSHDVGGIREDIRQHDRRIYNLEQINYEESTHE